MSRQYYCEGTFREKFDGTETWLSLRLGRLGVTLKMDEHAKLCFIRALLGQEASRSIVLPATVSCPPLMSDKSGYTIIDEDKLEMPEWG